MSIWFLSIGLIIMWVTLIGFQMLNHPWIPRLNQTWSWCDSDCCCCYCSCFHFASLICYYFAWVFLNYIHKWEWAIIPFYFSCPFWYQGSLTLFNKLETYPSFFFLLFQYWVLTHAGKPSNTELLPQSPSTCLYFLRYMKIWYKLSITTTYT
jgi:hypothetical protein